MLNLKIPLFFLNSSESFPEVAESSRYPRKVGIKATEIEFSAKSLLKRFGIIKAIPNASANFEVPKNEAFVISRTSPRILEQSVKNERESPEARSDFFVFDFFCPSAIFLAGELFSVFIFIENIFLNRCLQ